MNTILAVVLICAVGTTPDACNRDTALDVVSTPVPTPMACAIAGQTMLSRDGLLGPDRYPVTRCERRHG